VKGLAFTKKLVRINRVVNTTLTAEIPSGRGGWSSCTMRNRADMGERSKYGGSPVINSIIVEPTLL